jgi:hypothetical protein
MCYLWKWSRGRCRYRWRCGLDLAHKVSRKYTFDSFGVDSLRMKIEKREKRGGQ